MQKFSSVFISLVHPVPTAFFFDETHCENFCAVEIPKNSFFSDFFFSSPELFENSPNHQPHNIPEYFKSISSIFCTSGPASFTALRNVSVFVNSVAAFSPKKIEIFAVPSFDFLQMAFPKSQIHILPAGKREFFACENRNYTKKKWDETEKNTIKQKNCGGFMENIEILEEHEKEIFEKSVSPSVFLSQMCQKKKSWKTDFLEVDYGALPNIGEKREKREKKKI